MGSRRQFLKSAGSGFLLAGCASAASIGGAPTVPTVPKPEHKPSAHAHPQVESTPVTAPPAPTPAPTPPSSVAVAPPTPTPVAPAAPVVTGVQTPPFILQRTGTAYPTLQAAYDAANNGDTIKVRYSSQPYVLEANGNGFSAACNVQKNGLTIEWETPGLMPRFDISAWAQGATTHGGSGTAINMGPSCTSLTVRGLDITGYPAPYNPQTAFVNVESGYPYQFLASTPYT